MKTGPVSALMSVPSGGGIRTGVAGITASFNVTTFDAYGNRRFESAGDSVVFVVAHRSEGIGFDTAYDRSIPANTNTSAAVAPFDEATGTYSFSYFTTLAGNVFGELIINGVGVPSLAPFIAKIAPGKVDPSRVVVSGEGLNGAVRGGAVAPIRILARDAFGNAVSAYDVQLKIFVDPRAPLVTVTQPLPIVDSDSAGLVYAEGGYVVSSKAELRSVRVIVTLGDATLIDASAAVVEPSGRVYVPETSVAIGSGLHRVAAAGEVRTFRIVPRDDKRVALIGGSRVGGNGGDLFPPAAAFRVAVAKLGGEVRGVSGDIRGIGPRYRFVLSRGAVLQDRGWCVHDRRGRVRLGFQRERVRRVRSPRGSYDQTLRIRRRGTKIFDPDRGPPRSIPTTRHPTRRRVGHRSCPCPSAPP